MCDNIEIMAIVPLNGGMNRKIAECPRGKENDMKRGSPAISVPNARHLNSQQLSSSESSESESESDFVSD